MINPKKTLVLTLTSTAFFLGYCGAANAMADQVTIPATKAATRQLVPAPQPAQGKSTGTSMQPVTSPDTTGQSAPAPAGLDSKQTPSPDPTTCQEFRVTTTVATQSYDPTTPGTAQPWVAAGDGIDLDNVNYQLVTPPITLNPNLTYQIKYVPQSPTDLYFGDAQGKPIANPVNAGTYYVYLSQTGFDNYTAGNDIWVSTNGGKYVFYKHWDVMKNLDFGPYSPLTFGHGTYTISPYQIKATVTGNSTLTQEAATINPEDYQISFAGAGTNDKPFDSVSHNFSYDFQPGDLEITAPTMSQPGQVTLSTQGWQNLRAALTKVFNDFAGNYVLDTANLTSTATVAVANPSREVTRTIIVESPDGHRAQYGQVATLICPATLNVQKDGVDFGPWGAALWPAFEVPQLAGYRSSVRVVPFVTVDGTTTDTTITVSYQLISQSGTDHGSDAGQPGKPPVTGTTTGPASREPGAGTKTSPAALTGTTQAGVQPGTTAARSRTGQRRLPQMGATEGWTAAILGLLLGAGSSLLGLGVWERSRTE